MKNNRLLLIAAALLAAVGMSAQTSALDFFTMEDAEAAVFCTTSANRLDMADYFRSGLDTPTPLSNNMQGRILDATERSVTWQVTPGIISTLHVVGSGKKARLLVIESLDIPARDSRVTWYDLDWQPVKAPVDAPVLADWLTDAGRKEQPQVEAWLPYMTATARLNDDATAIIYTNTVADSFLEPEDMSHITTWLKPEISVKL